MHGHSRPVHDMCLPGCAEQAVLVQYVVLRADLWKGLGWPLGSIIAQACHAATAALWLSQQEPASQEYCAVDNLDHMHKVCLFLFLGEMMLAGSFDHRPVAAGGPGGKG